MKVLLDTCVVSEVARNGGAKHVRDRVAALQSKSTFVSVITLGEITNGIARLAPGRKKTALQAFLLHLEQDFQNRILDVGAETAHIWGEVTALARSRGRVVPPLDGLIGATALHHGLRLMTRNVNDFEEIGVRIINPWEDA